MNKLLRANLIRIILAIAVQVLVFRHVPLGPYAHIFFYPIVVLLFPVEINTALLMLIAFFTGLTVDIFYHTIGVHAGAMVFMAFMRPFVLRFLQPHLGYERGDVPVASKFGLIWYLQYASWLMFGFIFAYYALEAFSFVYFGDIILKSSLSFVVTMIMILIHQMIFNPKH